MSAKKKRQENMRKNHRTDEMRDQNFTSIFFSERNFLAIVEAVQGWTLKTYQQRIDKSYNETILEIMKAVFNRRGEMTDVIDLGDYLLTLNKQVLRQTLETISQNVNPHREPERLKAAENFQRNNSDVPSPHSAFRLGDNHIIPKTDKTSLPSEDPSGENNTMELYEKESKRRQAEAKAAPDAKVPLMSGTNALLPTIFEGQEEEDEKEPEFLNVFQAGFESQPSTNSSQNSISSSVSDQADSHIQAINQSQNHVHSDTERHMKLIPTKPPPPFEIKDRPSTKMTSNDVIPKLQTDLQNLIKKVDLLVESMQLERKSHDKKEESSSDPPCSRMHVFTSADRNFEKYKSINQFEVHLREEAIITKLLLPRYISTVPYIRLTLNDETRVANLQNSGQDFWKAEIVHKGSGPVTITISDLNERDIYPRTFDVVKILTIQIQKNHVLVETGLHHLREGDTIRLLDIDCDNSELKRKLSRPKGFTVSIVDHVHFIISELDNLENTELYIGSLMKLKQQVFVEFESSGM